jgi:hypothetical protein
MKPPTVLLVLLLVVFAVGCDETTDPGCTLPTRPQLAPNSPAGVIGFELIRIHESSSLDAVFINGGCEDLQINLDSITLTEPGGTSHFSLGDVSPASGRVEARGAFGIPITFTSPGRGVYLATLSFTSNAENLPSYELDLVAPSGESPIPDEPDIEPFEEAVAVEASAAFAEPAAFVRFYNLGGKTLQVSNYTLGDDTNFTLLDGTATPSAPCIYGKVCGETDGLDQGCCEGGLTCRCLSFDTGSSTCLDTEGDQVCSTVNVTSGQFAILGIQLTDAAAAGTHSTTLEISSNDPDHPVTSVTVTGTK